jgi:hypothetical protein
MWVRDNKVWYEAELIELIKALCKPASNYSTDADAWALGKKHLAKQILEIIQENEK